MGSLLLVRHAQASLFAANYDQLSELGREQARRLGQHWTKSPPAVTALVTGPAERHKDTLSIALATPGLGSPSPEDRGSTTWPATEVDPDFDEHDAFSLVAQALPQLRKDDAELDRLATAAADLQDPQQRSAAWQHTFERVMRAWLAGAVDTEDVESWPEFAQRVSRGLDRIMQPSHERKQRVVLVSSVGPSAVIVQRALNLAPIDAFRLAWRQRNCSRSRFVFRGPELTLDAYNLVDHLPAAMQTHR